MERGASSLPTIAVDGTAETCGNPEISSSGSKKRHRNRKGSGNKHKPVEENSKPLNNIQVMNDMSKDCHKPVISRSGKPECPKSQRDPKPSSTNQREGHTPRKQPQKGDKKWEMVTSCAARNGSAGSSKHLAAGNDTSKTHCEASKEPQPGPSGGQRDKQQHGNRRQNGDQRREKKPMFTPHWSKDMVSQGLKRGFLVEGSIRINPKNYEEAYLPEADGISDVYISGFANRNRAMNGDIVAVQMNDPKDWRVHMDTLEKYEAELHEGMATLTLAEAKQSTSTKQSNTSDGMSNTAANKLSQNANCIIQSADLLEESCSNSAQSDNVLQNKSMGIYKAEENTCCNPDQCNVPSSTNCGGKARADQSGKGHTSQSDCQTNKTPKNHGNQNSTPASKGKYTSVKDLLSKDGCSPVAKKLFSEERQKDKESSDSNISRFVQKTGTVVAIIEAKHSRACSGHIKPMTDKKQNHALLCPTDHRCPRIMVPLSDCPKDFLERPEDHSNTLFIGHITDWPDTSQFAHGKLARSLGEAGQIEPETEGMLIEYDIDYSEFSNEVLRSLPSESPWVIPPEEFTKRKDFRKHCIFTIDPATAQDLDDALSCEDLGNGLYEVGVHIADVTHFLREDTDLDKVASRRATSVYLVQKVVPMLPQLLCEELCSLNPDKDRLTFSVIWHMNEDAEIQGEWFGRSVIRSCSKLSYDHAQGFIENPEREYTKEELPPITNGFTVQDIQKRVLHLNKLAQKLRKNRFDSGALRLDQVKLQFSLDKETGLPNGYSVYKQRESNKLVEEFMLLANMAVAHKILKTYPETALLRNHPPPQTKMLNHLYDLCINLEVPLDISSAGSLQRSLDEYAGDDAFSAARLQVLISLCSKPMQNARYFCTGVIQDEELFHHYALNVPVYTHFTSPIRRYADVIVHRLLGASLGYSADLNKSVELIQKQAVRCNDKKQASKCVQERSSDIFFAVFVKEVGPIEEPAMVMTVLDRSFDVFVLKLGVIKRVYCEKLPLESFSFRREHKRACLTLVWSPTESSPEPITQEISIFTMVTAVIQADKEPLKWSASVLHPEQNS